MGNETSIPRNKRVLVKKKIKKRNNIIPNNIIEYTNKIIIKPPKVNINNIDTAMDEFTDYQKKEHDQFIKRQKEAKDKFTEELKQFEQKFDPYKILSLPRTADSNQLKKHYKKLALKYHPDKGGDSVKFSLVTKAYALLLPRLEATPQKSHDDLRTNSKEYINHQNPIHVNKNNFDLNKFNKVFEDFRNEEEEGYSYMMTSDNRLNDKDPQTNKIFKDKFNVEMFNQMINEEPEVENQMIKYEEPQPLILSSARFTELGATSGGDFTSNMNSNTQYTDYRRAHTYGSKIIPQNIKQRESYKSINDIKHVRSKINYDMSDEDKIKLFERQKYEQEQEQLRLSRLAENDILTSQKYEQINRLFIKN